jgi:hypothetical protein
MMQVFYISLSSLKIPPLAYSEGPLKKIFIKKLVGMSTIFHSKKTSFI